jgi:hypothetical protein
MYSVCHSSSWGHKPSSAGPRHARVLLRDRPWAVLIFVRPPATRSPKPIQGYSSLFQSIQTFLAPPGGIFHRRQRHLFYTLRQPTPTTPPRSFFSGNRIMNPHSPRLFPFKGIQSYSKQFKAIQGFLETFFYFYAPLSKNLSRYDNVNSPIEWSLDLLWCLDVAPKAFGVGAFAWWPSARTSHFLIFNFL